MISQVNYNTYNKSGKYMLYTIKANPDDEIASIKKVGDFNGINIEEIVNDFLYNQYNKDYTASLAEITHFFRNPNYIQDKVTIYIELLFLDGFVGDLDVAINDYIESLKTNIRNKILFIQTKFVPKSFDFIVHKYNLPELLEKDSYALFDSWYDGIDFIITYDPIIQT